MSFEERMKMKVARGRFHCAVLGQAADDLVGERDLGPGHDTVLCWVS
jgi:hypothetical protein